LPVFVLGRTRAPATRPRGGARAFTRGLRVKPRNRIVVGTNRGWGLRKVPVGNRRAAARMPRPCAKCVSLLRVDSGWLGSTRQRVGPPARRERGHRPAASVPRVARPRRSAAAVSRAKSPLLNVDHGSFAATPSRRRCRRRAGEGDADGTQRKKRALTTVLRSLARASERGRRPSLESSRPDSGETRPPFRPFEHSPMSSRSEIIPVFHRHTRGQRFP